MTWVFHESDPMGGAAGEAYASGLMSAGMQPEHVLDREAIQNSVDATNNGAKARVVFRRRVLTGAAKLAFIKDSGLEEIAKRVTDLQLPNPNCFDSLDKPRKELALLYVEDHDAAGLAGDPHDKNSNFYRLLLSLGDRSKARDAKGTGGSYGFGKSVYSSSSASRGARSRAAGCYAQWTEPGAGCISRDEPGRRDFPGIAGTRRLASGPGGPGAGQAENQQVPRSTYPHRGIRSTNTRPELAVRKVLHRAGLRFRLHRADLCGRPDIALAKYRVCVFVHGCFWHRHEGCRYAYTPKNRAGFWLDKFDANKRRDAAVAATLVAEGWRVVVVWECQVKTESDVEAIGDWLPNLIRSSQSIAD